MQPLAPATIAAKPTAEAAQLAKAARDFEAMLLGKILESARPEMNGQQAEWRSMADRKLAETLAASSPLGVARMLEVRSTRSPAPAAQRSAE